MKTKLIIIGVITALFVSVTFKLKSNKQIVESHIYRPDADRKVLVEAARAALTSLEKTFDYTGTFLPYREVLLTPQVHGEVKKVFFNEGDIVKKGAPLLQIDDDLLQAQLLSAEATYRTAQRNLQRYENASSSGGVSKMQIDNLKLDLTNAESQLKQLRKQIELSLMVAPFSGTVTFRDVEEGSVVGGQPVARVTELSQLKLEIFVPEKEVGFFTEGETADIQTDVYPGVSIKGKIDYVSERGDNAHNYQVRIVIQNNVSSTPLKAGMYGTARLKAPLQSNTLMIPKVALLGSAKNPQVYKMAQDRAQLTAIQVGQTVGESIEVMEGLHEGDTVITTGQINLSSGSRVQVARK